MAGAACQQADERYVGHGRHGLARFGKYRLAVAGATAFASLKPHFRNCNIGVVDKPDTTMLAYFF
jgi:hypothetical protein